MSIEKKKEKIQKEMKRMLDEVPDMQELGFAYDYGGGWQIFTAVYFLNKHSQRLNWLTRTLIVLTAILAVATIVDIIVRIN